MRNKLDKRGQVAIYVIIAIVVVAGILIFFLTRGKVTSEEYPAELGPVFEKYQACIEQSTREAIQLVETNGGRVDAGQYVPGSDYAPFSSQLNFMGNPVPYWYYVAGNGIVKENVPSIIDMQNEISNYVEENLAKCDFSEFYGVYSVQKGMETVKTSILDSRVDVVVDSDMLVKKGEVSARKVSHEASVNTKLGKFYNIARAIYDKEKSDAIFEDYALDVLYLYAPVDGVEIQCAPKIWLTRTVFSDLRNALENNFAAIKFKGNYYTLNNKKSDYFVIKDVSVDESVNVLYSKNWPTKIEVAGNDIDDELMIAEPIGTQEGMGIMGFCYVPYHFVYDVSFPVMIQIYDGTEIFEFPIVVVIDKNVARQAELSNASFDNGADYDLCKYRNKQVEVDVYNTALNPVDANISFSCFDQRCRLGETRNGVYRGMAPTCVNGYISARSWGYEDAKKLFSTNEENFVELIMEKKYKINVSVKVGGSALKDTALVSFTNDEGKIVSAMIPGNNEIDLSEGNYEVRVYVYGNTTIVIPAATKTQCATVPKTGLLGIFGMTDEKCFDIKIPETRIDNSLVGGGKSTIYVLESELQKGNMEVNVNSMPRPTSLDMLAENFETFESRQAGLRFYG